MLRKVDEMKRDRMRPWVLMFCRAEGRTEADQALDQALEWGCFGAGSLVVGTRSWLLHHEWQPRHKTITRDTLWKSTYAYYGAQEQLESLGLAVACATVCYLRRPGLPPSQREELRVLDSLAIAAACRSLR